MAMPPMNDLDTLAEAPLPDEEESPKLNLLRELRVEAQELQTILESVRMGETTLDLYAAYIQKTREDITELLAQIRNGDSIRHLQNIWEQMNANPLIMNPEVELSAQEQLHHLNMLESRIRRLIFQIGALTIPARVNAWLDRARPGYYIPFHLVFEDEVPSHEDRVRILQYLAWSPKVLRGGLVDVGGGVIYRYAERSGDRLRSLVFLVLGFVAVTLLVAGSGYITAPGWPIARTHVPILLIGWAATVAGLLTHVAVGTAKRARSQDGLPPAIVVGDFMLMVDAKLGHFLLRLVLALVGFFGFVFTTGLANVTALDTFLVGYTLDSVVELFGVSIEERAATQNVAMKQRLGVVE